MGVHIMPNCNWCGIEFEAGCAEQVMCTPNHARKARARRTKLKNRDLVACPTPNKKAFTERGLAVRWAFFKGHYFYDCDCGKYHLTSKERINPDECMPPIINYEHSLPKVFDRTINYRSNARFQRT